MKRPSQLAEFSKTFDTDEKCLQYLCDLKWANGFKCQKCDHTKAVRGRTWYYRRCQNCKYDESCYAHTLFHKLKIPITTAFILVYQLSTLKKGMSCCEISRQHKVHRKTAWFFRSKIQKAMNDKAFKGFKDFIKKDKVVKTKKAKGEKQGRLLVQVVCSVHQEQKAVIDTIQLNFRPLKKQKWEKAFWLPAKSERSKARKYGKGYKIEVELSRADSSGATNLYIYNLRNWLAGIHHLVSLAHLQRYLNEFQYKYDKRECPGTGPREILQKVVELGWMPYKWAKAN
jgi:hypothetical protein